MRPRSHNTVVALLVGALALLAACGDDAEDDASGTTAAPGAATEPCAEVYSDASDEAEGPESIEDRGAPEMQGCVPTEELEVIDLIPGTGETVAEGDTITAHYVGVTASTGELFDSSWDRGEPATFPLTGVIQGWSEGLIGMQEGGRRTLVIPADLAYGDSPPPGSAIAPGAALVFTVDLVEIEQPSEFLLAAEARGKPTLEATDDVDELVVADEVDGTGAEVQEGDTITAHYVGVSASTGEEFDSSWDRGAPATFPLTGVIQGWSEGLVGMREGGRRTLVIPADLAYGDDPPAGSTIEPGATLVFTVDLVGID